MVTELRIKRENDGLHGIFLGESEVPIGMLVLAFEAGWYLVPLREAMYAVELLQVLVDRMKVMNEELNAKLQQSPDLFDNLH